MSKLLVVDDEQSICWGLTRLGESIGHDVVTASSAEQALDLVEQQQPDVIVLDVRLPGMDGLTAIKQFQQRVGQVPIIVITAYGDLNTAVEAVRNGAFEYIVKPFDLDTVQRTLVRALKTDWKTNDEQTHPESVGGLVGKSAAMQEVFKRIALATSSDACVLLAGESGTGKELAARAIHQYSGRANGPFVAVNVASLSPSLAESELFGHERGAFTGAEQSREGLMVRADGGTLFLDEVADIPLPTQVKLLRALEHGEVTPVGSNEIIKTNFRVVSATHQHLLDSVKEGRFRHDLYFRLCAFQIDMPPLRARPDDIAALAEHFLTTLTKTSNTPRPTIPDETLEELRQRQWYGNVRELRNAMEHAMIVARGGLMMSEHLPPSVLPDLVSAQDSTDNDGAIASLVGQWTTAKLSDPEKAESLYEQLLQLVEPPLLKAALDQHLGQCAAAARILGLHRTTLRKKLDQYGIDQE